MTGQKFSLSPQYARGLGQDPKLGFRRYPVRPYFFRDGLFVRGAAPEHARLAGARVLRIGNASAGEAYRAVREITPRDNEMGARFRALFLMVTPEVLHALRLVDDMERARFTFEVEGRQGPRSSSTAPTAQTPRTSTSAQRARSTRSATDCFR